MTKAYICYEDGTPSEAQTFTDRESLVKALTDALDMFESHYEGSSDLAVREFHCTFSSPSGLGIPVKQKTWEKNDDKSFLVEKNLKLESENYYKVPRNYCSKDCNSCKTTCHKKNKGYYDKSMSDYCEKDFEV